MKHLLFIFITLIFSQSIFAQKINDEKAFFNFTYNKQWIKAQKVESVTVKTIHQNKIRGGTHEFSFDKNGVLLNELISDSTGKKIMEYTFVVNSKGDLVQRIERNYELNEIDTIDFLKEYNNGLLTKETIQKLDVQYAYEYSESGKLIKTEIESMQKGEWISKKIISNEYDNQGRITRQVEKIVGGDSQHPESVFSDRSISYDANGNPVDEVEKISPSGSFIENDGNIHYSYGTSGDLQSVNRTNGASEEFRYDDTGKLISKRHIMPASLNSTTIEDTYSYTFYK